MSIGVRWKVRFQIWNLRRRPFAQDAFVKAPAKARVFLDLIDAELEESQPDMDFVEYLEEQQFVLSVVANSIADVRGETEISWMSLREASREFEIDYDYEEEVEMIDVTDEVPETEPLMDIDDLYYQVLEAYTPEVEDVEIGEGIVTYIPMEPDWRAYQ
jgi:hypothetical protein